MLSFVTVISEPTVSFEYQKDQLLMGYSTKTKLRDY